MRTGRVAGVGDVKSCVVAAPARFLTRLRAKGLLVAVFTEIPTAAGRVAILKIPSIPFQQPDLIAGQANPIFERPEIYLALQFYSPGRLILSSIQFEKTPDAKLTRVYHVPIAGLCLK